TSSATSPGSATRSSNITATNCSRWCGQPTLKPSSIAEGVGVSVDRGRAAEMGVEHLRSLREIALVHEIDHALHGFSLVDGIGDHAFEARAQPDRLLGLL